jgi:AraC family transcriptional activator of pobA
MNTERINYVNLPGLDKVLMIEPLDYTNPYDFKKMHRHDYFEIILVNEGEGNQLIDFTSYNIAAGDAYVIYPGQVHLMNRETSNGLLIQFRKDLFEYLHPVKHYHLYSATSLHMERQQFDHLYDIAQRIRAVLTASKQVSSIALHKAYSYLQIILISLIEAGSEKLVNDKERHILEEYLSLITAHILDKKKVSEYCAIIGCNTDKLNEICKRVLGKTALELIHEEQLLEIRRLLLLNEMSLKEICYHLNFDSQANFSGFIKTRTGLTPTELQKTVLEMYN